MLGSSEAAAAIAFLAFGANFMAIALLLLFNPRSRAIRWFALFGAAQLAWLALQGVMLLDGANRGLWYSYQLIVHMLPALFFAAMVVHRWPERWWVPYAPIAAGMLTALLFRDPLLTWFSAVWHSVMWGTPALLYARMPWQGHDTRGGRRLGIILGGIVPVAVLGAVLLEGNFVLYVLPLLTVMIQLMLFYGVVYHRYYDIEVRAARSGELAAAAAEQDRLALLGELAATIAHEVRNPLTGIRSLTQMLAEPFIDDERRGRYTGVIMDEITRLDRIVGNLTDLARRSGRGSVAAVSIPLATLFEDLMMLVEPRAHRAGVTLQHDAATVTIHAPREPLAQALLNLLINAVTHSPPGGTVRVAAARAADDSVSIAVTDEGPGVPADERARIFEPFHSKGGTGLGLAVVRRIADEYGWTVTVGDAEHGGALFSLRVQQ